MTDGDPIREGQILTGPLFSEPMRVETVAANGPAAWTLGLVGTGTERFRRVALTKDQLATLTATSPAPSYTGDGGTIRQCLGAWASASSAPTSTRSGGSRAAGRRKR